MLTEWWICIFQVEKTQRQRFFATFFNANAEIVKNLNISKARGGGEFVASYSEFSLNTTTGFAEGVVEYSEKIWSDKLEEHLAEQGAACITILTFAHNDNNQSAGAALARVWKSAKGPGFEMVSRGECNARLLAKAEEITLEDAKQEKEAAKAFDEKTQAVMTQTLLDVKETMVTKDVLKDTVAGVATKEDVAKSQEELTKMRERAEHAENFSFVKRGQLGAEESEKTKSLRMELEMKDREIANLKRQMTARDRNDAERDNHIRERDMRVEAHISRTEQFIKQMEDSACRREESDGILREILGRLERGLEDV